jgi:hypothetical protein
MLQVRQFRRQPVRFLPVVQQVIDAVVRFEFGQRRVDLPVQFGEQFFDAGGGSGLVSIGVGQHARAINTQLGQAGETHVNGGANHLPMDVFDLRLMLSAKLADGRMCVATISFPGWRQLEVPVDDCVG